MNSIGTNTSLPSSTSTRAERFLEVLHSPELYAQHYLKIVNKAGRLVPLLFNSMQREIQRVIQDLRARGIPPRLLILKARKEGCSTGVQAIGFQHVATTKHRVMVTIADEDSHTQALHGIVERFYNNLSKEMKPHVRHWRLESGIEFNTPIGDATEGLDSTIVLMTAGNIHVGRAFPGIHIIHGSEVGYWKDPDATLLGMLPAVPPELDTLVVLESTANGMDNWFYVEWQKAVAGESGYTPLFFPWYTHDEYRIPNSPEQENLDETERQLIETCHLDDDQVAWMRLAKKNYCGGDWDRYHQEFPSTPELAFIARSTPFFDQPVMLHLLSTTRTFNDEHRLPQVGSFLRQNDTSLSVQEDKRGYVSLWQLPIVGETYLIGVDTVSGQAERNPKRNPENLSANGWRIGPEGIEQVSVGDYLQEDTRLVADQMGMLGQFYQGALLVVEMNGSGLAVINGLQNFWWYDEQGHVKTANVYARSGSAADQVTVGQPTRFGFATSPVRRAHALQVMRAMLRAWRTQDPNYPWMIIRDERLVREMSSFIQTERGKWQHAQGAKDDRILSAAMAADVYMELYGSAALPADRARKPLTDEEKERLMREMRPSIAPEEYAKRRAERVKRRARYHQILQNPKLRNWQIRNIARRWQREERA